MPKFSTIDIDITVGDWNDNPPIFYHSPYYVYLQEEAANIPVQLVTVSTCHSMTDLYSLDYDELAPVRVPKYVFTLFSTEYVYFRWKQQMQILHNTTNLPTSYCLD